MYLGTICDWRYGPCALPGSPKSVQDAWTEKYQSWSPESWYDMPRKERDARWKSRTVNGIPLPPGFTAVVVAGVVVPVAITAGLLWLLLRKKKK